MEILVKRKAFSEALDRISGAISAKPSLSILSGILFDAKDEEIVITATDLDNTIRTTVAGKVASKGITLLPGKKVISLIKQLSGEEVKITAKDSQVLFQSEDSNYSFLTMNQDEFPKLPKFTSEINMKLPGAFMKKAVQNIVFCIYPEEPRPHFRGGLLDITDTSVNFIATDTKRLAQMKKNIEGLSGKLKALLSYKLLSLLPTILPDEGDVEIGIGKNQILIKIQDTVLTSQLLDGSNEFPDYTKVIPDEKKLKVVKLPTEAFQATLKRIALFTSDRYNKVKFSITKQRLIISVNSPDVGEAQEKLAIDYDGEEQNIAFNPEYILDFLHRVPEKNILLGFTNETKPVLLHPEENTEYLYVAMPLKLD